MTLHPRSPVFRALTTALVMIQMVLGGLAAIAHTGARPGAVTSVRQTDDQSAATSHDDVRCPLCQFASEQAQPLPTYEIAVRAEVTDEQAPGSRRDEPRRQTQIRPSTRAPPTTLA